MNKHLLYCMMLLSSVSLCAAPQDNGVDSIQVYYTDYLPKARQASTNFIISKVEYGAERTIMHFRYVSDRDRDVVRFYGSATEQAWVVSSPRRPGSTPIEQRTEIYNIRINNQLQLTQLLPGDQVRYSPQKGDIVSCEIHFNNMPSYVRSIDLINGDVDPITTLARFTFADLMLKTANNTTLGTPRDMEAGINLFYSQQKSVRYPNIKEITSLVQEKQFQESKREIENQRVESPLETATKPLDYMPKMLNSVADLQCRERVILQNVYFEEDATDFSRKHQAYKTLDMIVEFLNRFPDAQLVLHGHTDIFGDEYKNLMLSRERVNTVKRALVLKGIDRQRIITLYHGGTKPLPLYQQGGSLNRRVEAEMICDKPAQ